MRRLGVTFALALAFVSASRGQGDASKGPFEQATHAWNLPWDADWVTAVSFVSPTRVAAGNNRGDILMWELPADRKAPAPMPTFRLVGHDNTISRLRTTPDGKLLVSSSWDRSIRVWDPHGDAGEPGKVTLNARAIEEAESSKKKKAPAPVDAKVAVRKATRTLAGHKEWVTTFAFDRDGKLLASGDEKGEIVVWDFAAGTERNRWKTKGWIWGLALSPDGSTVAASERIPLVFDSGRMQAVRIWDSATGQSKLDLSKTFDKQVIGAMAYAPDGKTLAVGRGGESDGLSGKVTLVDAVTGKAGKELTPGHLNGLTDVMYLPDGKHVVTCGRDTLVRIWDVESAKLVKELGKGRGGQFKDWIHAASVSPDGRWLAAADMAGQVQIWALREK